MRVGLYGGSFDPPHAGHRHVAALALKRFDLHRVWWIIGPGNPLKDRSQLPSSRSRMAAADVVARHPRMVVTGFEAALGARYSIETLRFLLRRYPTVRFVWIVGADSFAGLHRWRAWRDILAVVPVAVVDRPGWTLRAQTSRAAVAYDRHRISSGCWAEFAGMRPPAWTFIGGPRSSLSSTALRDKLLKSLGRH